MSSLTDRLAAASRHRVPTSVVAEDAIVSNGQKVRAPRTLTQDTFTELKARVHNQLLQQLGPKLYDADLTQSELEQMVRATLQEVMSDDDGTLITMADRTRIAQESADDILGYGPIEPFL